MADAVLVIGEGTNAVDFSAGEAGMEKLRRATRWRWPTQETLDAAPARSPVGKGDDTITLNGITFPGQRGAADPAGALRALGDLMEPQPLADGSGRAFGEWVVLSVTEEVDRWWEGGHPRKQSWTVELGAFVRRAS